jgi:hypothetical protein
VTLHLSLARFNLAKKRGRGTGENSGHASSFFLFSPPLPLSSLSFFPEMQAPGLDEEEKQNEANRMIWISCLNDAIPLSVPRHVAELLDLLRVTMDDETQGRTPEQPISLHVSRAAWTSVFTQVVRYEASIRAQSAHTLTLLGEAQHLCKAREMYGHVTYLGCAWLQEGLRVCMMDAIRRMLEWRKTSICCEDLLAWCGFTKEEEKKDDRASQSFDFRLAPHYPAPSASEQDERALLCTLLHLSMGLDRYATRALLDRLIRTHIFNLTRLVEHALAHGYLVTGESETQASCLTQEPYWTICHRFLRSAMLYTDDPRTVFTQLHPLYQAHLWSSAHTKACLFACLSLSASREAALVSAPTLEAFCVDSLGLAPALAP